MTLNNRFSVNVSRWKTRHWWMGAAAIWLMIAILAALAMSVAGRLLAFSILTGALLIAAVYELNKKDLGRLRLVGVFALIWLAGGATLYLVNRFAPREEEVKGALIAGTVKTPSTGCDSVSPGLAPNELLMIFGGDGVIGRGNGPFVPVRIGACPALSIARTPAGLMINAFGFDSDDNVVYRIKNNQFEQVIGGFLKGRRPDRSTLVISDDRGVEALSIHYLNKSTIQILGTFRCGNTKPVRITKDFIAVSGIPLQKRQCIRIDAEAAYGLEYSDPRPDAVLP